jgi:hypothetical protein
MEERTFKPMVYILLLGILPSQWAMKAISQNLTIAIANHIQTSTSHILKQHPTTKNTKFNTSTIASRYMHSTYALSSAFYIASAAPS